MKYARRTFAIVSTISIPHPAPISPMEAIVNPPSRGSRLDADHPQNGVLIPCRFTGVDALPSDVKAMVIRSVATFTAFTPENDPHDEHDFGSFELTGQKFFWKIDYYDAAMEFGSEDPADPAVTTRVLTIMLASEY